MLATSATNCGTIPRMTDKPITSSIVIREIAAISEMRAVEALQREVWGCDDLEVFPALAMIPLREVGAVLLGAFAGEELVGFVFGFPGLEAGQTILHSDMLAVKSEYRGHHLGERLKLAQRDEALKKGIETITWTFDPLQAVNAHLNFGKLGVTANRYLKDFYGKTTSFLHRTGSDRLWVNWRLNSEHVKQRILQDGRGGSIGALHDLPALVSVDRRGNPELLELDRTKDSYALEIPGDINRMTNETPELAVRWREVTRTAFVNAFAAGYVVADAALVRVESQIKGRYLLGRAEHFGKR